MDELTARMNAQTPYLERLAACHDAALHLSNTSLQDLRQVYNTTADLMQKSAPNDARVAGFAILAGLLSHPKVPDSDRQEWLQSLVLPADPPVVEQQFKAIRTTLSSPLRLPSNADKVVEHTLDQLLPQFDAQNAARKRARSENRGAATGKDTLAEERGMHRVLEFQGELVGERPDLFPEPVSIRLFELVLSIAEKASASGTVERVCLIIKSVIIVSRIPSVVLQRCLEDLCAIYNTTQRLKDVTWECLELLLKSEHQDENEIVSIVLDTIGLPPQERQSHTVCGAIRTARFLMSTQGNPHIPTLQFDRFLIALSRVNFGSRRIRREVLRTIGLLLTEGATAVVAMGIEDWAPLIDIIDRAIGGKRLGARTRQSMDTIGSDEHDPSDANDSNPRPGFQEDFAMEQVVHVADTLAQLWPRCTPAQRKHIAGFFFDHARLLPDGFVTRFLKELLQQSYFSRPTADWQAHQIEVVDLFGVNEQAPPELRCTVVLILKSSILESSPADDHSCLHHLLVRLLNTFQLAKDLQVGNALADLLVSGAKRPEVRIEDLKESLELIWPLLSVPDDPDLPDDSARPADFEKHAVNSVTVSLVELFLHVVNSQAAVATVIYNQLVSISNAQHLPSSVRLPAIQLLTRVRCDLMHRIWIVSDPDIQGLASTLSRTDNTATDRYSLAASRQHSINVEEKMEGRAGRASGISAKSHSTARTNPRSSTRSEKHLKPKPPLWLHPGGPALPLHPPTQPSEALHIYTSGAEKDLCLHLGDWLANAISILQQPSTDWEVFSYVVVHLPAQLSNRELFCSSSPHIRMLRRILVDQLLTGNVYEPPYNTGVRKGDIALCLYHALTMLVGYSDQAERDEQERIVQAFVDGVTKWERTARFCIQSLTICCLVLPSAVTNWLSAILQRMSQMITQSHLAVDILEFLAYLARHRRIYVNFREEEYRTVFAICVRYLEHSREQRLRLLTAADRATQSTRQHEFEEPARKLPGKPDLNEDLPQYVFSLAYQVLTVWFLAVKIGDRCDHVGWITKNLAWKDASGDEIMEEQSQVTLDMMMRTAYLNLNMGETMTPEPFDEKDGRILTKTWLLGLSIVTIETAASTGVSRVTKRQAAGTTYAMYRPQTFELPPHHEAPPEVERGSDMGFSIFPNHILLSLTSSIAPIPSPLEAICLPEDDAVTRALSVFDRNDTVDGYKVGVVYVGNNQQSETEILANTTGSPAFERFLSGLGTKVKLQAAKFNTQGLDREADGDGQHTYAWRDRVTEIVFHVPTMMPTRLATDPHCISKKRHIGNDYVNIIWNESGHTFRFDTFASQFNCVNIVIVPDGLMHPEVESEGPRVHDAFGPDKDPYYTIQVFTTGSFPDLSPAAHYQLLPLQALPSLARQLALQSSVFSNVWMNRDTGEHASSWRNRLREIKKLRERYANTGTSTSAKYPGAKSRNNYNPGDTFKGRVVMGGLAELGEDLVASLDFSRWAGPNAYSYDES